MSRNKKPRKPYRPRHIAVNTLELAMHHAAKPTQEDLRDVLQPVQQAVKALREGLATEGQWSVVAGAVQTGLAIERQGIVRGLQAHLASADAALQAIYRRAKTSQAWRPTALYYQELEALQTFVKLHSFQIHQLGRREFIQAINQAERQVKKDGHVPTLATSVEQLQAAGVLA